MLNLTCHNCGGIFKPERIKRGQLIDICPYCSNRQKGEKEIERKFLVKLSKVPRDIKDRKIFKLHIQQVYLQIADDQEVRFRKEANCTTGKKKIYYTEKKGKGMTRDETEFLTLENSFESYYAQDQLSKISKRRWVFSYEYKVLCEERIVILNVDHFYEIWEGVPLRNIDVIVEIEFKTEEEAEAFVPPVWFIYENCQVREVTNDERFKNKFIARDGWPKY